eukprot:239086-Alexandrium_andersonii.AAC.1
MDTHEGPSPTKRHAKHTPKNKYHTQTTTRQTQGKTQHKEHIEKKTAVNMKVGATALSKAIFLGKTTV